MTQGQTMMQNSSLRTEFQALLYKANQKAPLQPEMVANMLDEMLMGMSREMLEDYLDKLEADANEKRWKKSIEEVGKNPELIKLLREDAAEIEAGGIDDGIE